MGLAIPQETKLKWPLSVHVCAGRQSDSENVPLWEVQGLPVVVCVCVCALWGETVNYLHSQTPDNATTVQGRASASGKQPSSLLFYLCYLRFLSSSLYAMLPTPFSPSTDAQSIIADSVRSVCSMFSHVSPSSFLWNWTEIIHFRPNVWYFCHKDM